MPIKYDKVSDRDLDSSEINFRNRLSDLVDEAIEAGTCPIAISLALELAFEAIDRGTVVRFGKNI